MSDPRSVLSVGAMLGEGPIWVARDSALWFVDIKSRKVHRFDPASGDTANWDAPGEIGWILPTDDGAFLTGVEDGLYRFAPDGDGFSKLSEVEPDIPGNRQNDAAIDPAGRVWFGTMDNAEQDPTGHVYRFDAGRVTNSGLAPVTITNGPAIAPDGRTLYAVDTLGRRIDAHTITETGELTDKRAFLVLDESVKGSPDGAICDSEAGVWVGFYGGSAVRRYDPSGNMTDQIDFPVSNITKIALGGADGRDAYATTARKGLSEAQLREQPLAGNLFHFRVKVPGIKVAPAKAAR